MKDNCISYSLATKYIVIILGFSLLAFLIAFRLHDQGKNTYAAVFLAVSIIVTATSTYKKKISSDYSTNRITINKTFFGFCFSQFTIFIDEHSKIKLYEESSLGHQGGGSTRHLILSVTGRLKSEDIKPSDIDVVSEHIDKNKKAFIDKAKTIANRMKLAIQNES